MAFWHLLDFPSLTQRSKQLFALKVFPHAALSELNMQRHTSSSGVISLRPFVRFKTLSSNKLLSNVCSETLVKKIKWREISK